jgi:hypothetical protein
VAEYLLGDPKLNELSLFPPVQDFFLYLRNGDRNNFYDGAFQLGSFGGKKTIFDLFSS